jgi:hypothetical protein
LDRGTTVFVCYLVTGQLKPEWQIKRTLNPFDDVGALRPKASARAGAVVKER